jgi:hypothetical protein
MLCTRESNILIRCLTFVLTYDKRGCEPLTPEDIAEVVVFAAGRRENVVIADSLVFPNHQAGATAMHKKT